jgi:hypothetical protein
MPRVGALEPVSRWLDRAITASIVATIVAVALGSGSVAGLVHIGHGLRWVALLAFAFFSVASYVASGARRRIDRFVAGASLAFIALVLLSLGWSVLPKLTGERGASLAVVLVAVAAAVLGGGPRRLERLADGVVIGAVAVVVLGVPVLILAYGDAVQSSLAAAPRYQGIGENPNTVSLLAALALPLAVRYLIQEATFRVRVLGLVAVAALVAQIAVSGSRGALAAGLAGSVVAALLPASGARTVLRRTATVGAVTAAALLLTNVALPAPATVAVPAQGQPPAAAGGGAAPGGRSGGGGRLEDELGSPDALQTGVRPFGSGRFQAWIGAVRQGEKVPLLGYGFGTEDRVFIDRYYTFQGARPENSFVGVFLQVGVVGLVLFLALLGRTATNVWRRGRRRWRDDPLLTSAGAAFFAGVLLMGVQSYVYSAGNIAALSFWLCAGICAVGSSAVIPIRKGASVE